MSLINEALKKAQSERGAQPGKPEDTVIPDPVHPHHPPRKKRSYLWGFVMAVLIVGLFSASISTFLVFKILGEEETASEAPAAPAAEEAVAVKPGAQPEAKPAAPAKPPVEESNPEPPAEPVPEVAAVPDPAEKAPAPIEPEEPQVEETPAVAEPAAPAPQATLPAAEVWARLDQLEIRGMMSGGTKVLIFDTSNGKTRSFVEGELVDGPLGLRIATIQKNAIIFTDHGGNKLTKSF